MGMKRCKRRPVTRWQHFSFLLFCLIPTLLVLIGLSHLRQTSLLQQAVELLPKTSRVAYNASYTVELAWHSGSVMDCQATAQASRNMYLPSFTSFARDSKWECRL